MPAGDRLIPRFKKVSEGVEGLGHIAVVKVSKQVKAWRIIIRVNHYCLRKLVLDELEYLVLAVDDNEARRFGLLHLLGNNSLEQLCFSSTAFG